MPQDESGEKYNAEELRKDLARIRQKLKRLDGERQSTVRKLEEAVSEAERLVADRREQPPAATD